MLKVTIDQLYLAYRKAKKEAFQDTNCAHGLKFAKYEKRLAQNLAQLLRLLNSTKPSWQNDILFIGRVTCIPKSVSPPNGTSAETTIHCQSSDPIAQWKRQCSSKNRAKADFRPVIDATVNFLVVAALWVLEVGHLYDEKLDTRYALGNRLRRWRPKNEAAAGAAGQLNKLSPDLFRPYFTAYGEWRSGGLKAMRRELEEGYRVVAVTMDLKRFYHQIDASFLIHEDYLAEIDLELTSEQHAFTNLLISAFETYNHTVNDMMDGVPRGLPVGLPASGLIANVLLSQFDRHVASQLDPSYYARYVDDVFLVLRHADEFGDGVDFLRWLGGRLSPLAVAIIPGKDETDEDGPRLKLNLPYADGSELIFVGKKQKIFQLDGDHGLDLIGPIEEQIKQGTSEHRDLPHLPDTESRMAHRALLVSSDATLNADALRKADAVTLRRSGFAMLLGDVEAHVRDLEPSAWTTLRHQFYELAHRHLLAPNSFFDFSRYFPRIVGIMATCGDWEHASKFIGGFKPLLSCLRRTCKTDDSHFKQCLQYACDNMAARMAESVLQTECKAKGKVRSLLSEIRDILSPVLKAPTRLTSIGVIKAQMVNLDWARSPYSAHWLAATGDALPPVKPINKAVRELLPFRAIRTFQKAANLPKPHWPALMFPTRPMPFREITARAPSLLSDGTSLSAVVGGLRGTWMPEDTGLTFSSHLRNGRQKLIIPQPANLKPKVAITSIEVSDAQWAAAADGTPSLTLERYRMLNRILDAVVAGRPRPNYVILPECCLPRRWAMQMAAKVLARGVSVIAGLEYRPDSINPSVLHNEALVALRTDFPGYQTSLFLLQPKLQPAWPEREHLANDFGKALAEPSSSSLRHPVYQHGRFHFGVLICSELTDIKNRRRFQGKVDALFIPEWNKDIESFSALIESAALDVHAYIAQANNRRYGDSRLRAPMKERYLRDLIRVKGGLNDYFVVGAIDYMNLRRFQSHSVPPTGDGELFKPFPIGFPARLSPTRRTTPSSPQ